MSNVNFVYLTSDLAFLPKQGNQALSQPFVAGLTSVSEPEFLIIIFKMFGGVCTMSKLL